MATVNYFIFFEIFALLERIEIIDGIGFDAFDPDVEFDVNLIAAHYIKPEVNAALEANRDTIARTIAFYTVHGNAPFQKFKDGLPDLCLGDAESWPTFFHWVGQIVFGDDYREKFPVTDVQELPDQYAAQDIFRTA